MIHMQADRRIQPKAIDKMYAEIIAKVDALNNSLKAELQKQRQAEEQERLRKIQESLEQERRQKAEEERRVKEEEDNRKKFVHNSPNICYSIFIPFVFFCFVLVNNRKAEIEAKRKLEEQERKRLEDADRKAALDLQAQIEREHQEDSRFRVQLEQERRDHELALRLAQESNGQVEDSPPLIRKYVSHTLHESNSIVAMGMIIKL